MQDLMTLIVDLVKTCFITGVLFMIGNQATAAARDASRGLWVIGSQLFRFVKDIIKSTGGTAASAVAA